VRTSRDPKGRTALITGSTAGQGARIAEALAEAGANIILTGLGDASEIEAARDRLSKTHGVKVAYFNADLKNVDEIEELVKFGRREIGPIDILINNAVIRKGAPVEQYVPANWNDELAVNLSAAFHLIRLTVGEMRSRDWGRIINMSSTLGVFGTANRAGYVTTKTALLGLTRAIAMETVFTGVTCNAVCPSAMLGLNSEAQLQKMVDDGMSPEDAMRSFLAARKTVKFVETLPEIIVFLCSSAAREMNGISLSVDLGASAGRPAA